LTDALIVGTKAIELLLEARLVACWLERAEASRSAATLTFNRSSRSGWVEVDADPREILLGQHPTRPAWPLSVESGSSLGFLMLGGHGRELVLEEGDWLGAGIGKGSSSFLICRFS
jgi:hypothetical protein